MQIQVLGLQDGYRLTPGSSGRGSEPRQGRVRGGKDVVNAELDLWLWFALLVGVLEQAILLGARPQPLWVQRAEARVGIRRASRGGVMISLQTMEGGFC